MRRVLLAAAAVTLLAPAGARAADRYNSGPYRSTVTVSNILQHEYALQSIADRNHGTRVAGSKGNDQTVSYIVQQMRQTGWTVKKQPFEFAYFEETATPVFERTAPTQHTYTGDEFRTMDYSGSGDVTGKIVPVDVVVPIGKTRRARRTRAARPPTSPTSRRARSRWSSAGRATSS